MINETPIEVKKFRAPFLLTAPHGCRIIHELGISSVYRRSDMCQPTTRRGVTLIELIIIIGGLLFLAALLLPIIARLRGAAGQAQSQNNLRQMALAVHNYFDAFRKLPPGLGKANNADGPAHFHILPFIEQDNLFKLAEGAPSKNGTYGKVVYVYVDPADKSAPNNMHQGWLATTNYAANWMVFRNGDQSLLVPDGTSNTLMFATRYQMCNGHPTGWGYPTQYYWAPTFAYYTTAKFQISPKQEECDPTLPQTVGSPQIQVGFCDGSVRRLDSGVSPRTWHLLCDPADGIPLDNDF
jgi:type II secretory pathway pseudopilin PulG